MQNLEALRTLVQWVVELGDHDILYEPRTTIKEQVAAGFVAELQIINP